MSPGAKLAKKMGVPATPEAIAKAHAAYRAEDERIQAAYARQFDSRCDEWCAKTGGTPAEYIAITNFDAIWREKLAGA